MSLITKTRDVIYIGCRVVTGSKVTSGGVKSPAYFDVSVSSYGASQVGTLSYKPVLYWEGSITICGQTIVDSGTVVGTSTYSSYSSAQSAAKYLSLPTVAVDESGSYKNTSKQNCVTYNYTGTETYKVGTVTVKVTNGSSTKQVSSTTYNEGESVAVSIPNGSSYFGSCVLTAVSINGSSRSYNSGGYTLTINDCYTVIFQFTPLRTIKLNRGVGGGSFSGSSTTSFTGSTSSGSTIYAEQGQNIYLSATAAAGYVLGPTAITSSSSLYGSISGRGNTSLSATVACAAADNTFTLTGSQYAITTQILDGADNKSSWGMALIKESSATTYGTSATLKPNTTYDLSFSSSTTNTYGAEVDYWTIQGSDTQYTTSFTTGSNLTGDLIAYLYLKQTKWLLSVAVSPSDKGWGSATGGGWYANGTEVTLTFTPSADVSNLGIVATQVNYNNETSDFVSGSTITTTNTSQTATIFLKQTKFKMSVGYGNSGTDEWGTISADKEYVGTGDEITFTFTPKSDLVATIHPQVEHWSILQQSPTPTENKDGSSSITITLGEVSQDFTATAYLASAYRKVTIQRNDSGDVAWGGFYLNDSGTTTTKYYAPGSTIALRFVRDTTYDLKERPQVNVISIGEESTIYGVDGTYDYAYTLPTNTKSDLVISCSLKQTAYAVAVKTDGNGSLMAQRMDVGGGIVVDSVTVDSTTEKIIYLRYGNETEYLALTATGKEHYDFSAWEKSNLSSYNGDVKKVYLSTAQSASVAATFTRNDFLVTCTTDNDAVASAYLNDSGATSAYYSKSATQNPVVVCKIKSSYAGDYKVASWSIGTQDDIAPQYNAQGDFYYVEVTNWNDVTVTAHIVRTTFKLTVNVGPTNYAEFGSVVATASAQTKTFSTNNDTAFTFTVKETANVSLQFYQQYGGRVLSIEKSDAISEVATDDAIEFAMPSADCSVTFTLGEKEKYQLTVGVQNTSSGEESAIPATLEVKSRTYPKIVVGTTDASGVAQTFTMFCDEEYAIVATAVDDTTSRRYKILGWKDGDDYISGADGDTIYLTNESTDALTRTLVYGLRETGTVTIEYAQKSGSEITVLDQIPDGCSFTLTNTQDKIEGEDKWLVGADIKMPYVVAGLGFDKDGDAYKWTPVEVDIAFDDDEYSTNVSWDDGVLTQNGEFVMRGNVKIRVIFVETYVPGYTAMKVGYKGNTTTRMGSVSIFATDMDAHTEDTTGASALVRKTKKAVIMAAPRPGFMFAGWWTLVDGEYVAVSDAKAVYEIAYATSPMTTYYAEFVGSTISNVKQWNGDPSRTKTFEWQSRVYVGAQFFKMQSVRAYSDAYPVTLTIFAASSPDDIFGSNARTATVVLADQNPRRLPKVRPEKYFAFKVEGYSRVNLVGIASSMGGLLS